MAKRLQIAFGRQPKSCCKLEDRISLLPDEILVTILSSLELRDAAATSVLARRWRSLWKYVTRLNFNAIAKYLYSLAHGTTEDETLKYVDWVNQILQLHKGPSIEEFKVWFYLDKHFQKEINTWLQFALARRVQQLEVHLSDRASCMMDWNKCSLPCKLFSENKVIFLDKLPSNSSTMRQCNYAGFQSLKSLSLTCVNVSGKDVEYLLSICSVLERLCILGSGELVNLKVAGPSLALKFLKIGSCYNLKSLEVCNMINLVSFAYTGGKVDLLLKNVPSLIELSFDGYSSEFMKDFFPKLSWCFPYLETLALPTTCFEDVKAISVPQKLNALKKFVLHSIIHEEKCLLPYTSFIKASPILQKFVLQGVWVQPQMVQPCITRKIEVRKDEKCAHQYLKEVQLIGYYGRKSDLELVMYFLENAVALKKIVIDPCDASNHSLPKGRSKIEEELAARNRAKQQLKKIVPENICLVIL